MCRRPGRGCRPEQIAGFAGRPYAEVAFEVIRPFTAGDIDDADLDRMCAEAYATFRHPAVAPLVQLGPGEWVLELFHGPTLAFKDLAMQLLSRLMDHVAGPARREGDDHRRHLGRHRRRGDRGVSRTATMSTSSCCSPRTGSRRSSSGR